MSGLKTTAQRLQMALNMQGRNICVTSRAFYSTKYGKIVTCWKIKEKNKLLMKTYSIAAVVQELAKLYKEEAERDG